MQHEQNGSPAARLLRAGLLLAGAFALIGGLIAPSASATVHLKISASAEVAKAFENWTAATPWGQIKNYRNASRPVVDLLLELQALKAGGLDFDFEIVPKLNYEQAKIEVVEGRADLTAETIWGDEIAANPKELLKTDEIIRNGEFAKGVYVLSTDDKMLKLTSRDELHERVGAVVATWLLDVKTMEGLKLKDLIKTPRPELVFAAIQKKQADFTLAEFSASPDMGTMFGEFKFVPVPNCKVPIMGSRSFIVAKASPQADAILAALAGGVKILRENGTIERAFKESGFFNPRVADWKLL
jgi:hypothetical protein